jgi:hypothetical protein
MKEYTITLLLLLGLCFTTMNASEYVTIQVKSSYTGGWGSQQTKLVSLISGYQPITDGRDDFTRYGTYKYLRTDSTGFFYVKKIDGRWWMIDPNGYAGINMGVCSFGSGSIQNDYDITRNLGFNGSGNFLGSESQTKNGYNLQNYSLFSYTRRINFFLNYKNVRKNYYTTPTAIQGSTDYVLVFDPQFETYCDNLAKTSAAPYVNERDLLGYYTDNEINFNQDQLRNFVKDLPAGDPSRDSALVFAASKGLTESDCINYTSKVTEAIKQEFAIRLATRYYRIVAAAIRKYDQNHLILGSRLNGRPRAIPGVVAASQAYMDVTSVNFYDKFAPNDQIARADWTNDKPCIVGEFYIKDINAFSATQSGAGWYVNSQEMRGDFYQNTCLELLQNKCFIGWQYFKYQDDSDSNKGIVNSSGTEYAGMTSFMKELNEQVYHLCDFYDGKDRRKNGATRDKSMDVSESTYVVPSSASTTNYGSSGNLEVCYNATETNRREAFVKFDLSSVADSLPLVKHAELQLYCTQSDGSPRYVFAGGLADNSWNEFTLTGALRNANLDWYYGYNRLSYLKSVVNPGIQVFDITNWIIDNGNSGVVSFKIFDLNSTNTSAVFASGRNADPAIRPRLKLTFWNDSASGLIDIPAGKGVSLYPNPATNEITITGYDIVAADILDVSGRLIKRCTTKTIDIRNLPEGMYVLRIVTEANKVIISKFIKV